MAHGAVAKIAGRSCALRPDHQAWQDFFLVMDSARITEKARALHVLLEKLLEPEDLSQVAMLVTTGQVGMIEVMRAICEAAP
jgi:hypothetical protein